MREHIKEYIIRVIRPPHYKNLEEDLKWICKVLGITSNRDRNETSYKIFREILYASRNNRFPTIEELSNNLKISRTAVLHHVRVMMERGIIIRHGKYLEMRTMNLENTLDEIFEDLERAISNIKRIAESIDKELKLPVR